MYYYICDPPTTKTDQAIITSIRSALVPEGIGGEFVMRSVGESVGGLVSKAIVQGFSTIVAIGGDQLINELGGVLYDQQAALGILPLHISSGIETIIGYHDWRTGIQALRHRKLHLRDIAAINAEHFFINNAEITVSKSNFILHMNRFTARLETSEIILQLSTGNEPFAVPGVINFVVPTGKATSGFLSKFFASSSNQISTLLRAEQAAVLCENEAKVTIAGKVVASTPISVEIIPQALRVVVARQLRAKAGTE